MLGCVLAERGRRVPGRVDLACRSHSVDHHHAHVMGGRSRPSAVPVLLCVVMAPVVVMVRAVAGRAAGVAVPPAPMLMVTLAVA